MTDKRLVAYFSMEIALEVDIPTYSGGLGVLAGDTIRAAADRKVPLLAVTLLHRKGFFYQKLDQSDLPPFYVPGGMLGLTLQALAS